MDFKTESMREEKMDINLKNILPSLAKALYGEDWRVSVRELLQNAHDALIERQAREKGRGDSHAADYPTITITPDPAAGTLTFRDNGVGMTADGVRQNLATVGAGYKREAIENLANKGKGDHAILDQLIGQYGIGFLSSFIIADQVLVRTKNSEDPKAKGVRALFTGETSWYLEEDDSVEPGTEVILQLKRDPIVDPQTGNKESVQNLLNSENLKREVRRFGDLLPFPITVHRNPNDLNGDQANTMVGPWEQDATSAPAQLNQYIAARHPDDNEPLLTFPFRLTQAADRVNAHGMLYIPRPSQGQSAAHESIANVELFCRRMFITDDIGPLLPSWINFISVVVECPDLSPTLSRNDVIRYDPPFVALKEALGRQIVEWLSLLAQKQPKTFSHVLHEHRDRFYLSLLGNYQKTDDETLFRSLIDYVPFVVISQAAPQGQFMTLPQYRAALGGAAASSTDDDKGQKSSVYFLDFTDHSQPVGQIRSMILKKNIPVIQVTEAAERPLLKAYGNAFSSEVTVIDVTEILDIYVEAVDETPYEGVKRYLLSLEGGPDDFKASRFEPSYVPAILSTYGMADPNKAETLSNILAQGGSVFDQRIRNVFEEAINGAQFGKATHVIILNDANPLVRRIRDHLNEGNTLSGSHEDALLQIYHMAQVYADPRVAESDSFYTKRNEVLLSLIEKDTALARVQSERDKTLLDLKNTKRELLSERERFASPEQMERRTGAMLLTDIKGSTRMVGFLDEDDGADILQGYAREVTRLVEANGGKVEKFTGDGIFAYFGLDAEQPREGVAAAAKCAAAIQDATLRYFTEGEVAATLLRRCITVEGSRTVLHWGDLRHGKIAGLPALVGKQVVLLFRACDKDDLFANHPIIMTHPFYNTLHLPNDITPIAHDVHLDDSLPPQTFYPHPNFAG